REAVRRVKLQHRRALAERQLIFIGKPFVGSQDQHAAIAQAGKLLEGFERLGGKQERGGGQILSGLLQDGIPCRLRKSVRSQLHVLIGKLQGGTRTGRAWPAV